MSTDVTNAIRREVERIEEDAEYSHKGHYAAAELWGRRRYWLGVPAALTAALASALIFFDGSPAAIKLQQAAPLLDPTGIAAAMALLATVFATLMTALNPAERAVEHQTAGGAYLMLRNQARIFRDVDLVDAANPERLRERLHALDATRNQLNQASPKIPTRASLKAKEGIESGESTHRVDRETA
jgi:hypothetical protein